MTTSDRILLAVATLARTRLPPTIREIGAVVGIASTGHVCYHLAHLDAAGMIHWRRGIARGITVEAKGKARVRALQVAERRVA